MKSKYKKDYYIIKDNIDTLYCCSGGGDSFECNIEIPSSYKVARLLLSYIEIDKRDKIEDALKYLRECCYSNNPNWNWNEDDEEAAKHYRFLKRELNRLKIAGVFNK